MRRPKDPDFEESADMRLVDLQRAALGVSPPDRTTWESQAHTEGGSVEAEPPPVLQSAVLAVETAATPPVDVIPGAIVTVAMSVANEGAAPAKNVRAGAPLPGGVTYRNGSFVRDGRPLLDDAAEEFFGAGTAVGTLAPGSRATFVWKIGVRLGNKPLVIAPVVTGDETAVVGAQPVIVSRKAETQTGFATEVQRFDRALYDKQPEELPIYELDEEEIIEHEAAAAALSEYQPPMEPPLQPVPPPDQPEPVPPPGQPAPVPEPGVPEQEPYTPEPPTQPPDVEPAAQAAPVREAVVLYGRLDRPSIAYFERIFTGSKPPTLLNHFILGGALACTRSIDGGDVAGLKAHMDAQGQVLQRIVLHEKIGKKEPIAEYAGKMLARIDQFAPAAVAGLDAPDDSNIVLLEAELEAPTLGVLGKMQEDSARWDFTKARQLTLALQARRVAARAPYDRVEAAENALRAYAQTAATQLQRFFVRMRIDRTTGLLFAHDETLDAAARSLVAALISLFPLER
ncbi:MAG TPA: hypothetical protein VJP85_12880 [Candidatus Baltobacteraceae bacterium]|nr:hypothetical protein [Candidatus Baltobacteraceae bacterium]